MQVFGYSAHISCDSSETPVLTYVVQEEQPDRAATRHAARASDLQEKHLDQ